MVFLGGIRSDPAEVLKHLQFYRRIKQALIGLSVLLCAWLVLALAGSGSSVRVLDMDIQWMRERLTVAVEPALKGVNDEGEVYSIEAGEAVHAITSTRFVQFSDLKGTLQGGSGRDLMIMAPEARLDSEQRLLDVHGPVNVSSGEQLRGEFGHALLDLATGEVSASKNVAINMNGQALLSERAEIYNGGDNLDFFGRVRVYMPPSQPTTKR